MDILNLPIELPKCHSYIVDCYKSLTSGVRRSDTHLYLKSSAAYDKGKNIPFDHFRRIDDVQYQCKSRQRVLVGMSGMTLICRVKHAVANKVLMERYVSI